MAKAMTIPDYHPYQQAHLNKPQLQFSDIAPLIEHYQVQPWLTVTELGRSVKQQPIYQLQLGQGDKRILAWSQMHGDESTATAALFDLLNYLQAPEQAAWREQLFAEITLYIIPMLNPDGAAKHSRVNAQGIDINRDALALQSPEGQLLMAAAKQIKPHFAFNLHDQNRFHAAGPYPNPATISLLAPAYNAEREINASRRAAMQLIAHVQPWLEQQIPQHIGRYADDWSARSFGDTFAAMGISTVLVESGAYRGDDNRQMARRLNFQLYVAWLAAIASDSYQQADLALYDAIPFNRSGGMKDVLLQGLTVSIGDTTAKVDLAINLALTGDRRARIDELGDLSLFSAFHQFSVQGLAFKAGQAYPLNTALSLDTEAHLALLQQGYTHFSGDKALLQASSRLPVLLNPLRPTQGSPQLWQGATFLLVNTQGKVVQAVLNGQLISVPSGVIHNPLGT
ncbi:M14 family zinc carboxypeptidase [Alishewanella sp. HL-SH05]|uniref:M14 family zinc carboxypeptidase n=1 Tax=Alishewanella sp. HL-SH05 TaxID=3461145 RepID=UPI004043497C